MTENSKLFNELKKLSKRANQRILRIERLTGVKEGFATKQLADYLSSEQVQGWTKKGRVRVSKQMTESQMIASIKATKQFLDTGVSRVSEVKKKQKEYTEKAGKPISFKQANTLYQSGKNYTWIYEYMTPSEFWAFVKLAKEQCWNKKRFIEEIQAYISKEVDEELKRDLEALYIYVMG